MALNMKLRGQVPRKQGLKLHHRGLEHRILSLRGQVPRKQGLKLLVANAFAPKPIASRASSTKTRIETNKYNPKYPVAEGLRGQVPRKQGLKPVPWFQILEPSSLRGQVPRKQGLKLLNVHLSPSFRRCPRASSTKTRIETPMSPGRGLTRDGWKS